MAHVHFNMLSLIGAYTTKKNTLSKKPRTRYSELSQMWTNFITAQCTLVHLRGLGIACHLSVCPSVCLSVTLVICDHIGWKSWKLIAQTISPAPSLFAAKRRSAYSQGNMGNFWGD